MPDATPTVFDPPDAYTAAELAAALPRMLMDGTSRLRAEGRTWLPPYDKEEEQPYADGSPSPYSQRVDNAVVRPFYRNAILRDVSSVLGKPIVLRDDVPAEIRGSGDPAIKDGWWENADLRGNDGNVFLRDVLKDAAGDRGFSAVLVDHPPVSGDAKLSDLKSRRLRPFWRLYRARDILEAVAEYINGRERAREIRLREEAPPGFERVRILRAAPWNEAEGAFVGHVTFELWQRKSSTANDAERQGEKIGEGDMRPHVEIPMVPLYYMRTGFFAGRNAYEDLAYLNLKHTRNDCRIGDDLDISSGAQLHRTGLSEEEKKQRAIGPRRLLTSANPEARAEWLERGGSAATVYMQYQADLVSQMQALANEPHTQRSGNETATGRAIDTAEAKTEIQARCLAVRDFTEQLLMFTAAYAGHQSGGSVEVTPPPKWSDRDLEGLSQLTTLADKGWVRPETVLAVAKQQGILPDDVDPEAEVERAMGRMGAAAGLRTPLGPNGPPAMERVRKAIAEAEAGESGAPGPPVQ